MLTTKQKCFLRGKAQIIKSVFQIGKDGINDNMLTDIRNYINKHELMKISVLQNCLESKEEIADVFSSVGFEVVQIIGNQIIIYKENKKSKEHIQLP